MTVRDAGAQALAPRRPSAQARHLCVQPGFVDEDQPLRVQIRLRLEPGVARRGDVRAVLLAGVGGLFWNDQPWRRKKRCTVEGAKRSPCSRSSRSVISTSVMSGASATIARIAPPTASIRPERVSPPCARGSTEPVSSQSRRHLTAAEGAIPNRAAAPRQLIPDLIESKSLSAKRLKEG
jgi:hypothetical protein